MSQPTIKRKLVAILSADVKGYSRLMEKDEVSTIRTLTQYRDRMTRHILEHRGRVVDSPGDNLLAEFGSVVDALQCAAEIQRELKKENEALPESRRMTFRIGINMGDVIEDGGRIYGDGVNIAARLEGLAEGGGICISGNAFEQVRNKLPLGYEYLGEKGVKNLAEPVRVYRVLLDPEAAGSLTYRDRRDSPKHRRRSHLILAIALCIMALGVWVWKHNASPPKPPVGETPKKPFELNLPDRPSIAVLPFMNISGDLEQDYFSDGMTDDLITDLSKISGLFVISRNSVFSYKGKNVMVEEISKELGVRYLLEGSVRRSGDRVRINAQLIDTNTGGHVWAERYDRELKDIFALQDEVREKIVNALAVKLTQEEQKRMVSRGTENLEAYDYYLRGLEYFTQKMQEGVGRSKLMFQKAIELDPEYAAAYSQLGHAYLTEWTLGWTDDPQSIIGAEKLALKAIEIDELDASGHGLLGQVYLWKKQHDRAIAESELAVSLDPNNPVWLASLGEQLTWAGKPEEAIEIIQKAIRLDPKSPAWYLFDLGHAYFLTGEYPQAVEALQRALALDETFWPANAYLTACYVRLGNKEESEASAKELLRIKPNISSERWEKRLPYKDIAVTHSLLGALREAGIP